MNLVRSLFVYGLVGISIFFILAIKSIVKKTEFLKVNETKTAVLDCQISSSEKILQIKWTLNDTFKIINQSKAELNIITLNEISLKQAGIYECYAETNLTNYLTTINLQVIPISINVEYKSIEKTAVRDGSVILDCTWWFTTNSLFTGSSSLLPKNLTKWKVNSTDLNELNWANKYEFLDSHETILKIKNLKTNERYNSYSCEFNLAKNNIKISNFSLFIGSKLTQASIINQVKYINYIFKLKLSRLY